MVKKVIRLDAQYVLKLLECKHSDDVFVSECKNGSTWYSECLCKLDAWVMKRKWVNPLTIGYEIKVNRSDLVSQCK